MVTDDGLLSGQLPRKHSGARHVAGFIVYLCIGSLAGASMPAANSAQTGSGTERVKLPPEATPWFRQGLAAYRQGEYVEAVESLSKARDLAPGNAEVSRSLGKSLLLSYQYGAAREEFHRFLSLQPDAVDPQLGLARIATRLGDYEEATRLYRGIVKKHPSQPLAVHNLGWLHYRAGGYWEAKNLLTPLLILYPDQLEPHYTLGMVLMKLGDLFGAEREFLRVTAIDPDNQRARFNLAKLYTRLGKLEAAQREQEIFLRLSNSTAAQVFAMATARDFFLAGDFAASLKEYDRLVGETPAAARFHLGRGLCLMKLKRMEKAAVALEQAASLEPRNAEAFYNLAAVYQELGLQEKSEQALRKYENLGSLGVGKFY